MAEVGPRCICFPRENNVVKRETAVCVDCSMVFCGATLGIHSDMPETMAVPENIDTLHTNWQSPHWAMSNPNKLPVCVLRKTQKTFAFPIHQYSAISNEFIGICGNKSRRGLPKFSADGIICMRCLALCCCMHKIHEIHFITYWERTHVCGWRRKVSLLRQWGESRGRQTSHDDNYSRYLWPNVYLLII